MTFDDTVLSLDLQLSWLRYGYVFYFVRLVVFCLRRFVCRGCCKTRCVTFVSCFFFLFWKYSHSTAPSTTRRWYLLDGVLENAGGVRTFIWASLTACFSVLPLRTEKLLFFKENIGSRTIQMSFLIFITKIKLKIKSRRALT